MKPAHILLVDDSRLDVELTLDAFREARLPCIVDVASDGEEALRYLRGEGEYADRTMRPFPDLVLLDLNMPGLDGREVLRQIKGTPVLRRLPVVVLTSSQEEGDLITSYENGANSYLVKPVSFDRLMQMAQQIQDYWLTTNVGPPMHSRP